MTVKETKLKGCFILEPNVFQDERGYFLENYSQKVFDELIGQKVSFVQDNESFSSKGVLRGLHYQTGDFAQAKLVRTVRGKVLDVVVDIRKNSPTFGQHITVELSDMNKTQLFIPRGFAHGFLVLSNTAIFSYKCDNLYNIEHEEGIIYSDHTLNIDWGLPKGQHIVSDKDLNLPTFENAKI